MRRRRRRPGAGGGAVRRGDHRFLERSDRGTFRCVARAGVGDLARTYRAQFQVRPNTSRAGAGHDDSGTVSRARRPSTPPKPRAAHVRRRRGRRRFQRDQWRPHRPSVRPRHWRDLGASASRVGLRRRWRSASALLPRVGQPRQRPAHALDAAFVTASSAMAGLARARPARTAARAAADHPASPPTTALDAYSRIVTTVDQRYAPAWPTCASRAAASRPPPRRCGQHIVITPDGFTLASAHVVERADEAGDRIVRRRPRATPRVWRRPLSGLAVLRLDSDAQPGQRLSDARTSRVGGSRRSDQQPLTAHSFVTAGVRLGPRRFAPRPTTAPRPLVDDVDPDGALRSMPAARRRRWWRRPSRRDSTRPVASTAPAFAVP